MYEENRRFDWAGLFIKLIIVVIFILFTVWLLSLSNRGMSTSLGVLTDNVFSENMEKMKEVGKSYFTNERLPQKVGEVNTLTLDRMYDKKLLLPLKDKNGKTCSASGSYVSIQKMDTEYQMKVYLECPDRTDYIVVIMGCYNYCDADICEKQDEKALEYEYKKTIGGAWTDWSNWSDWSKTSVTKTSSRDVETKVNREDYTYEKNVTENKLVGNATCASVSGYALVSNSNGICTYKKTNDTKNPTCPSVSGYTLTSRNGFDCSYKSDTPNYKNPTCPNVSGYVLSERSGFTCSYDLDDELAVNPICPSVSGYTVTGRNGFTCSYTKNNSPTTNPTCPSVSGYTYTGRNGFTCNYTSSTTPTTNPVCPTTPSGYAYTGRNGFTCNYTSLTTPSTDPICPTAPSGYTYTGRNGFTCNYAGNTNSSDYTLQYYGTGNGSYVPADNNTYHYEQTDADYIYNCNKTPCAFEWYYIYKIYKKVYSTVAPITRNASCPNGYTPSGNTCIGTAGTTTRNASCPNGYTPSGNTCVGTAGTTTRSASCPNGYTPSGNTCVGTAGTTTRNASCPNGYVQSGNTCIVEDLNTTRTAKCPSGYSRSGTVCVNNRDFTITRIASCPNNYDKLNNRCVNYPTTTRDAKCPSGYTPSGNTCAKTTADKITRDAVCKDKQTMSEGKCYEKVTTKKKVTEKRDVTYYRYRTRSFSGGTIDYKWSTSNNDKSLLNAGYTLTGKTREVTLKGGK